MKIEKLAYEVENRGFRWAKLRLFLSLLTFAASGLQKVKQQLVKA